MWAAARGLAGGLRLGWARHLARRRGADGKPDRFPICSRRAGHRPGRRDPRLGQRAVLPRSGKSAASLVQIYTRAHERDTYHRAVLEQDGFGHGYALICAWPARSTGRSRHRQSIPARLHPALCADRGRGRDSGWRCSTCRSLTIGTSSRCRWSAASTGFGDPDHRPERDLVAVAPDGTFAAFCYCEIEIQ